MNTQEEIEAANCSECGEHEATACVCPCVNCGAAMFHHEQGFPIQPGTSCPAEIFKLPTDAAMIVAAFDLAARLVDIVGEGSDEDELAMVGAFNLATLLTGWEPSTDEDWMEWTLKACHPEIIAEGKVRTLALLPSMKRSVGAVRISRAPQLRRDHLEAFLKWLTAHGMEFHLDDDPSEICWQKDATAAELAHVAKTHAEIWERNTSEQIWETVGKLWDTGAEEETCGFEAGEVPNKSLCGCAACERSHPSRDYTGPVPQEWIIDRD